MAERPSTSRSRDLGKALVKIRRAKGLNGNDIAKKLGWERGKVTRAELGKQAIEEMDLIAWLAVCEVPRADLHRLVEQNREISQDTWLRSRAIDPLRGRWHLFDEEEQAETFTTYGLSMIPGMLQRESYIRAVAPQSPEGLVERMVASRIERQKLLRDPKVKHFEFLIDEYALRRSFGGPEVMHDQLMGLVTLANWRRISIRVVLTSAGWHGGAYGGFLLIERRDGRKLVYLDTRVSGVIYENPDDIKQYEETIEEISKLALSEVESQAFITALAEDYRCLREGPDEGVLR